jgi:hypothetical protein
MQHRTWAALVAAVSLSLIPAVVPGSAGAGWIPAQTLGVGEPGPYYGAVPDVAMNAGGDAAATTGPEDDPLTLSTRAAGADAFGPVRLPFTYAYEYSALALGDDGRVALALRPDAGPQVATGPLAGPLSAPTTVAPDPWPDTVGPHVATAGDGAVVAVWSTDVGDKSVLRWALKPPGGAFGAVHESDPDRYMQFGGLSVSRDGHALITYALDGQDVYAVSRAPGEELGAPRRVSEDGDVISGAPTGAIADGGKAVVAFSTTSPAQLVLVDRSSASAPWGSRATVATGPTIGRRMVADRAGDFLLAYEADTGDGFHAVLLTGRADGTHDAPHDLGLGTIPAVAMAGDGTAVAVWSTFGDVRLRATRRPPGGGWSTPEAIDDPGDVTQLVGAAWPAATLAADADGDLVVGWVANSGNYRVRLFDAAAPRLDGVSVPAAATPGQVVSFSARAHDFTPLTVAWDLGDGTAVAGADVRHAFAGPGTYTVRAMATDAAGQVTSTTRTIAVVGGTPPPVGHPPAAKPRCVVPSLTNHTLAGAKAMLRRAHCALGKATTPKRFAHRKGLVVRSQSRRARTKAGNGAEVNVTLGVTPKPRRRS